MKERKFLCKEFGTALILNFKLIFHNKIVITSCGILCIIFFMVTGSLAISADERSSIPIGIIDKDQSILSKQLIASLQENDSIYLNITDKKTAQKLLNKQLIMAFYEINPGFERNIMAGDSNQLIDVYYLRHNQGISILSDIIAAQMMYDICLNKSLLVYRELGTKHHIISENEYRDYVNQQKNNDLFNFHFDIEFVNIKNNSGNQEIQSSIKNSLLYQQAVVGMIGFLLSFMVMFFVYSMTEPQNKLRWGRQKISSMHGYSLYLGQFGAVAIMTSLLSGAFAILLAITMNKNQIEEILQLWFLMIIYCWAMSVVFIIMSIMTTRTTSFQALGSFIILSFGGVGTAGIIFGGQSEELLKISKIIPNYWFIKEFTDIIISGALIR